jgi:hypothetical protein
VKVDKVKTWHITNMPSEAGSEFVRKSDYDILKTSLDETLKRCDGLITALYVAQKGLPKSTRLEIVNEAIALYGKDGK